MPYILYIVVELCWVNYPICTCNVYMCVACRIREAKENGEKVIDVDGSYVYRKCQLLQETGQTTSVLPVNHPPCPPCGWETISQNNYKDYSKKIPLVTSGIYMIVVVYCIDILHASTGMVYEYMSKGVGIAKEQGAFRALTRGYLHWSSGRIDHLEVNLHHPNYAHIRSSMKPSMKQGTYHVYLLLE